MYHSSELWVCMFLRGKYSQWAFSSFCSDKLQEGFLKPKDGLTCCQDELTVSGRFDRGAHCGHLKVLNEFNPPLDVWKRKRKRKGKAMLKTLNKLTCLQCWQWSDPLTNIFFLKLSFLSIWQPLQQEERSEDISTDKKKTGEFWIL